MRMSEKSPSDLERELLDHLAGERAHTLPTILLIAEMDRRQTFVERGFSTIWDYLRRVHKQSDTMIHYRLSCARAVNRSPRLVNRVSRVATRSLRPVRPGRSIARSGFPAGESQLRTASPNSGLRITYFRL